MSAARQVPAAAYFRSPFHIRPGTVVFDRDKEMVGVARQAVGQVVTVDRPSGLAWEVPYRRLRPGTTREVHQLRALARLHRIRRRGLT
ncbi:hypothetical protein [Streptomyces reniochalinae]|uniref:Uncharacterized protein n=1 Tax=Streptomyces reniochalinae TaxID=2250578 RepID=A0A367EJ93_9ACTN|nr:hypothetical protein [Streptomyces reniochalinae]RCG18023.1 hypothetical protein DQ392_15230 [Streptomyces reniochalinae]